MQLQGLDLRKLYPFDSEINFLAQGDNSWVGILLYIFGIDRLNMGQILRLQRLTPFSLRMTSWEGYRSMGVNYLQVLKNLRVEALAEILDFAAVLV